MSSSSTTDPLSTLHSLLLPDERIPPGHADYTRYSATWASQKQQHPRLIVRPKTAESLARTIAYLYSTDLDFAIYGHGFMSTSAKDVLVNISAFDDFHLDEVSECVTVGAGQTWMQVYQKLENVAPGFAIVGARTPCVGVGGTIISGGFSYLSYEHGCISDPENLLDARVIKYDGSIVWASAEPELLWALRGGGGGFGVIIQIVIRAFKYPRHIWAGPILVPREKLDEVATGIERFVSRPVDAKVTMLLYIVKKRVLESMKADEDKNMLLLHVFDANGEEHGRSVFQWALDIPGAVDQTRVMSLVEVVGLQDKIDTLKGSMRQFWAPICFKSITKDTVLRTVKWHDGLERIDPSLADCSYAILELCNSCDPPTPSSVAWPRPPGMKHILVLATGCPADAPEKEKAAHDCAARAAGEILDKDETPWYLPNLLEDFQQREMIWGPHFDKLQALRRKYDPRGRFRGAIPV
ncbi:hypothetical protein BJX61DRAFT_550171 [Aspergillus egyptiacus]|nr:hypothetical protein BJX61DRAFT_550171 [Aspergillus egyptiacus]